MNCIKCGAYNVSGTRTCVNCGCTFVNSSTNVNQNMVNPQNPSNNIVNNQPTNVNQNMVNPQNSSNNIVNNQPTNVNQNMVNLQNPSNNIVNNQPVNVNQNMVNSQNVQNNLVSNSIVNKKVNNCVNKKNFIVLAVIVLVIIGVLCFILFNGSKDNFDSKKVFFLENNEGNYALFNREGKQLSDFIYTYIDHEDDSIIVEIDNKRGVVSYDKGLTVPVGMYERVYYYAGLYKVSNSEGSFLINNEGKKLYDLKDKSVSDFNSFGKIVMVETKEEFIILDSTGKEIIKIKNINSKDDPTIINSKEDLVLIFYNNTTYILDVKNRKKITSFESEKHYCINGYNEDGSIVTMNSCVAWYEKQDETYYKLIKDGKVIDFEKECGGIYYKNNTLRCGSYFLDSNLNPSVEYQYVDAYIDSENYVRESNSTVSFYSDGKKIKTLECKTIFNSSKGYRQNEIYIIHDSASYACKSDIYMYELYDSKGEKIGNESYDKLSAIDENGLMIAAIDNNYFLIDKNAKRVSIEYDEIKFESGYYIVTKNNLKGLIDANGKTIIDCKYSDISEYNGLATIITFDSKTIIYNLNMNKIVLESTEPIEQNYDYLYITKGNKTEYYTYKGKLFYES